MVTLRYWRCTRCGNIQPAHVLTKEGDMLPCHKMVPTGRKVEGMYVNGVRPLEDEIGSCNGRLVKVLAYGSAA